MTNRNLLEARYTKGLKRLTAIALGMLFVFFGGGIFWAASASVGGAVIAPGTVMVESNAKEIKHPEGGYVSEILVKDGEKVEAGQVLVRLDATYARSELAIVTDQLNSIIVTEARLLAETAGQAEFLISNEDKVFVTPGEKLDRLIDSQGLLLISRRASIDSQLKQLKEQILQTKAEITGLKAQLGATDKEHSLVSAELKNLEKLFRDGYTTEPPVTKLRREMAQIEGRRGALLSQIARAQLAISERQVQSIRVRDDARRGAMEELTSIQQQKARLIQTKITVEDRYKRLDIRTAQAGVVHDLQIFTVNGVIQPSEVLMSIVPRQDNMVIEARVETTDIDQVYDGQAASLMFTSFNMRTTPQINGHVLRVSPDSSLDRLTGKSHYRVRLGIDADQLKRLGDNEIVPGMPVDAFIRTQERTVANYLVQPIVDHMSRAFREE